MALAALTRAQGEGQRAPMVLSSSLPAGSWP